MKPEELTREEWDVFYPLSYWDIIVQESRARGLDPYQVAGLIRQETVFMSRARSSAKAYGLMQLLVPTGMLTAKKYGVERGINEESLYEPRLNIQLGTAYLRDQIDKFGPFIHLGWQRSLPLRGTLRSGVVSRSHVFDAAKFVDLIAQIGSAELDIQTRFIK